MSAHHHDHDHEAGHSHHHGPTPERALIVAIALNASFLVLEASLGWWTNSLALLSDAGHMVSDVSALILALVAMRLSAIKPSPHYTFGLRRAPVLGGLFNAISLVAIVIFIALEALSRVGAPPQIDATAVFWTGVAGLVVNLISAWYLARSRDESVNTRGAMMHLLSDALGSVAAIISAVAIGVFNLPIADPIASLVIAALILIGSWPLLRDTINILLQRAPKRVDIDEVRALILSQPQVRAVQDMHVWELDAGQPVCSAVIVVSMMSLQALNALSDELRAQLQDQFKLAHVTIEGRLEGAPEASLC